MANNHGGAGAKFVSVNLNKSYGQSTHHNYPPYSGSYGPGGGTNRPRPGGHTSAGGGMVVLSRNRPLQKAVPKLSVPPPLNLPSLRKEHEKIDSSGAGGGVAGGSGLASGSRPASSGIGWTKPGTVSFQEKDVTGDTQVTQRANHTDGVTERTGTYMPPSARFGGGLGHGVSSNQLHVPPVEKAMVLSGEEFPSLRAALPSSSGPAQKQKEGTLQKPKKLLGEESSDEPSESFHFNSPAHMQSSRRITSTVIENGGLSQRSSAAEKDKAQKQDDPLPLVLLNPRSDWADDERDTSHGFVDRNSRDYGLPKSEAYWERDFEMPRSSILPHKPPNNLFERRGQQLGDTAKVSSSEVLKVDPHRKDINLQSREEKESNGRNDSGRSVGHTSSRYMSPSFGENAHHGVISGNKDPAFGRRDMGQGRQGLQQHWNQSVESTTYGTDRSTKYRGEAYPNYAASRSSFSTGGKVLPTNDPLLNFVREGRSISKNERSYSDDPYQKDQSSSVYDERDPFTGNLVGVFKRKKDVVNQADFHDPVRESFEAELERVQKMQEMERKRIVEEQERALEQARREEEERRSLIREEEERRRRMEEEAREAAWRAEQERLEAIQKAEEQKIAREEEKRRMLLEEERRKQSAKQKLLELEARIAKRQAEVGKSDTCVNTAVEEEVSVGGKDKDASMDADLDNWEDNERMVERITTSASSNSSAMNRPFDRPQFSREGSSSFVDSGKPVSPWKRDAFEVGSSSSFLLHDQENGHHSPRRGTSIGGRSFPRKEVHGGAGYLSARTSFRGGMQDTYADRFPHLRDHRWNPSGDGDAYNRNRDIDSDYYENVGEKYGDGGWGQGHSRSNTRLPYSEQLYPNSELDELYSYGRSRYSMRQPRVLPPPSMNSVPKTSVRGENELSAPSSSLESTARTGYSGGPQENLEQSDLVDVREEIMAQKLDKDATPRCDSQSSLSVSSPPSSPTHLSHDELDESAGCSAVPTAVEGKEIHQSGSEPEVVNDKPGQYTVMAASNSVSAEDDEEWSLENNDETQEQEEYDEDDDGYQEEDEVHDGDVENINMTPGSEHVPSEKKSSSDVMDNLVLGFNEGVEVKIQDDEFENDARTQGSKFGVPEVHVSVVETRGSTDGVIHEPEKSNLEDPVAQPVNASHKTTASSHPSDQSLSAHHTASSSVEMAPCASSVQYPMPALSSVSSQTESPVKLQFGLFSGPTLIPSPVPSIQIGSIQMPLHLHPPIVPSIHQPQTPLFQFGQLRYTTPASQGILPMSPRPMPFVQPNVHHTHYTLNQNVGSYLPNQYTQENAAINIKKDDGLSLSNNHSGIVSMLPDQSHENWSRGLTARSTENNAVVRNSQNDLSHAADNRTISKQVTQAEKGHDTRDNGSEAQFAPEPSHGLSGEKGVPSSRVPGPSSAIRGKKIAYPVKNSGQRSLFQALEASPSGSGQFQRKPRRAIQRTEFRVRENVDRRQTTTMASSNSSGLDEKLSDKGVGTFPRSGYRRGAMSTKSLKQVGSEDSAAGLSNYEEITSDRRSGKGNARPKLATTQVSSKPREGNLNGNISEEDVDAPLRSGIVRVFKQPGIEAPSDEDDFIEVRSKRQMLNDRREQREKEIKAKSRITKQARKSRSSVQVTVGSTSVNEVSALIGSVPVDKEVPTGFSTMVSQPLAPIGTPAVNTDFQTEIRSQANKSLQTGAVSTISGAGKDLGSNLTFETKNKVIPLTQTQLDEAMKPERFDSAHVTSIGDHSTSVSESISLSSSILAMEKLISSSSPIDSLLAGEKIQFGAVTSPTILPSRCVVSHGMGAPGSFHADMSQNLSKADKDCTVFSQKDKHPSETCVQLEDCEAEAEAAASAVAVAAISTDEIIGNGLGPVSVSNTKSFGGAVGDGLPGGKTGDQQSGSQSRPEESLSLSLPADLSVETPPISLWPPLPSPQSSSTQMLSHFPEAPPSHFPFYDMNHPMMGAPVFAFNPHDESGGTQSQNQKSSMSGPAHVAPWPHHSGMDSFYGPTGFTGPFIGPPGGIQAPQHMVVYNHYAPVGGQFGQVGLSFMGATYIPSGKQPDWKHNPTSSPMEGDMNTINMVPGQHHPSSMLPPIQHLAPGSPLLPMGSPLPMFDVPPFQTGADMSVQARWSHVPPSHLHPIPMSLPLQQQAEGVSAPSHFSSHGGHQSSPPIHTRFSEPQPSTPSDNGGRPFPVAGDATVTQFPDELLLDSSSASVSGISAPVSVGHVTPGTTAPNSGRKAADGGFKNQHHHQGGGYGYQRGGGGSQRNNPVAEWSHRRVGHHGRNQSLGAERNFAKVKQIYVAKQRPSTGSSSTVG